MPKSQVSPTLPIEFSEVCEVVYQDLLGTNGRSLAGCFAVANASGKTYDANYVGIKDRLSNFRGFPVIVPGDSVYFDADYAIIEFKFLTGQDLDIRAQVTTPTVSDYIGWSRLGVFPASNAWLFWGGDNQGTGVESIFIDISYYKTFYPTQKLSIDMRAFWYVIPTTDPVSFKITLYKGGTKWPAAVNYGFGVDNPTASLVLGTELKEIKLNTNVAANVGQSIGVWEYNPSTFLSKVTVVTDNTAPTAPTLSIVSSTSTSVTLAWSGSTDANAPIKYALHSPTLSAEDRGNSANAWWDITSPFTVTGLITGTPVSYYIKAYDPTGNYSGASNTVSITPTEVDSTPPSQVTGITISLETENSFRVSWNASTDNVGVVDYQVTISYQVGQFPTVLNYYTSNLLYNVTGMTTGVQYTVSVRARDAVPNLSSPSANVYVTLVSASDTTPPSQVSEIFLSTPVNYTVRVDWATATDNIAVTQYEINESYDGSTWDIIAMVNAPTLYYVQGGYSGQQFVYIRVRAHDAAGNVGAWSPVEYTITTGDLV